MQQKKVRATAQHSSRQHEKSATDRKRGNDFPNGLRKEHQGGPGLGPQPASPLGQGPHSPLLLNLRRDQLLPLAPHPTYTDLTSAFPMDRALDATDCATKR